MRKHIVTAAAIIGLIQGLVVGTAAAADRYSYQPEGAVYVSYGFGGPTPRTFPLHYGLLMRYDDNALPFYRRLNLPPLLALDFDAVGDAVGMISGIPFMRHIASLNQNGSDGGGANVQTSPGGFSVVDWGLLGLGVTDIGYGISKLAQNKNNLNPQSTNNQQLTGSSGLLEFISGGAASASQYESALSGSQADLLLLDGKQALVFGACDANRPTPRYMHWLNGGTGQMGDLKPR